MFALAPGNSPCLLQYFPSSARGTKPRAHLRRLHEVKPNAHSGLLLGYAEPLRPPQATELQEIEPCAPGALSHVLE